MLGFEWVELEPGKSCRLTITADPRLMARFDVDAGRWRIQEGTHRVALARAANAIELTADVALPARLFGV